MRCYRCGFDNLPNSRFCNNCGAMFGPAPQGKKNNTAAWVITAAIIGFCFFSAVVSSLISRKSTNTPAISNTSAPLTGDALPIPEEKKPTKTKEELAESYKRRVSETNPYLNYIKSKFTKVKGGQALWLVHSMFTQSSFDFGNDAKVVQLWIAENRDDLKKAGIVRVGFQNESGYLGSCYFDLK